MHLEYQHRFADVLLPAQDYNTLQSPADLKQNNQ